jgi:large subunit ribosomal protein L2
MMKKQFSQKLSLKNQNFFFKKQAGRNNLGRITVRHQGGGHKNFNKKYYWSSFWQNNLVLFSEYTPKINGFLKRIISFSNNIKEDAFCFYKKALTQDSFLHEIPASFQKQLQFFEIGDHINSISLIKKQKPIFARSGGSSAIIIRKQSIKKDYITLKMPSENIRLMHREVYASPGKVIVSLLKAQSLYKAGQSRWLNIRPTVRGRAMNPIDHPHGGRTNGGMPPVSPWGRLTKGVKTRKNKKTTSFILTTYNNLKNNTK